MTRKHFEALAKALKDAEATEDMCWAIANVCARFNSNFDRVRFLVACGR